MRLYGQEINDQSYAICKSDMIAKGQDAGNIKLGDTTADDLFFDRTFDFCMSNLPFRKMSVCCGRFCCCATTRRRFPLEVVLGAAA